MMSDDVLDLPRERDVDWFAFVDPVSDDVTIKQGVEHDDVGAVGPFATWEEADEWVTGVSDE